MIVDMHIYVVGNIWRHFIGHCMWKALIKVWEAAKMHTAIKIGDGQRTMFWKDAWCVDETLEVKYNSLCIIDHSEKVLAAEL